MAKISVSLTIVCISLYMFMTVDACPVNLKDYPLLSQNCAVYTALTCGYSEQAAVPGSCNLYIRCKTPVMRINQCAPGTVFDVQLGICNHATARCNADNPCRTGKNISDNQKCYGYLTCEDGLVLRKKCPIGQAFVSGTCQTNPNCLQSPPTLTWKFTECSPIPNKPNYFLERVTMRNTATNQQVIDQTERRCPFGNYIKDCRCDPPKYACTTKKILDLSSVQNTWSSHRRWIAGNSHFKIRGTAGVSSFNGFVNWGYFDGQTSFELDFFRDNSAGDYWTLSFSFQAMRRQSTTPIPGLQAGGGSIALVGNSNSKEACEPTIGCQIDTVPTRLACFVRAERRDGTEQRYQQAVNFNPLVTTNVEFKRVGDRGYLTVTQNGLTVTGGKKAWDFNDDDAIKSTRCAGSIGSGKNLRNFLGVMDNVMFEKQCP